MTNQRLVGITYAAFGLVIALFVGHLVGSFGISALNQPILGQQDWLWSDAIGAVIGIAAVIVAWRTPKFYEQSLEIAAELRRVTWPTFPETRASTIAVIIATSVAGIILGLFDAMWQAFSNRIYTPGL